MTSPGTLPSPQSPYLCPKCGLFVDSLDDLTGWCASCTARISRTTVTGFATIASYSSAIGFFIATENVSVWEALTLTRQDRPRCIVCGDELHRSRRYAIFCHKKKECRRYSRRYVYLYTKKDLDKTQALAQIMDELSGLTGE